MNTLSGEISSLKPELKPKVKPNFIWENKGYDSYIANGFRLPDEESQVPGYWENRFLSKVDLTKGKIKVRVNTIIRQLAPDWSTDREDRKEYLTFNTDWIAKNYLGVDIFVRGHIEGVFMDQQRELVTKKNQSTGEETAYYQKAQPRETFYIPFTKKKVDEILSDHPFGEDSINITNKDRVLYYGKFRYATPPFRASCFNYEEFSNWTFQQMLDKASKTKSPYADDIEKMMKKFSHIT
jgi:hypothetical protein